MRLLTCLAATLLATTTLTTQIASACGGSYEASYQSARTAPQVMLVSSHFTHDVGSSGAPHSVHRAFALRGANLDLGPDAPWQRLAPMTYDYTDIITLAKLARPVTATLVGTSGTRVVRSNSRVALHHAMFISNSQFDALELPVANDDSFEIALAGNHPDAVWHEVEYTYSMTVGLMGTNIQATRVNTTGEPQVELRIGKLPVGTYDGYLVGAVDAGDARYVVLKTNRGVAYTVEVAK